MFYRYITYVKNRFGQSATYDLHKLVRHDMLRINETSNADGQFTLEVIFHDYENKIVFPISTHPRATGSFVKFTSEDYQGGLYDPVNELFAFMSTVQQAYVAEFYYSAHQLLNAKTLPRPENVVRQLQVMFNNMIKGSDILTRLDVFCKNKSRMTSGFPDFTDVGIWKENKDSLTFMLYDFRWLTVWTVLNKIVMPVWDMLEKRLTEDYSIRRNDLLPMCLDVTEITLRGTGMHYTYQKLENLVHRIAEKKINWFNKKVDVEAVLKSHNMTMWDACHLILARTIVQRLTIFDPMQKSDDRPGPNIVVYIDDGVKRNSEILMTTLLSSKRADIDAPKINGDDLFFSAEEAREGNNAWVRLIRTFFVVEKITNNDFLTRYHAQAEKNKSNDSAKQLAEKATVDRRFLRNPNKITRNMGTLVIEMMGYEIIDLEVSDHTARIVIKKKGTDNEIRYQVSMPR